MILIMRTILRMSLEVDVSRGCVRIPGMTCDGKPRGRVFRSSRVCLWGARCWVWIPCVVAGFAASGVYFLVSAAAQDVLCSDFGLGAVLAILVGLRMQWYLLASSKLAQLLGDVLFTTAFRPAWRQ